MVLLFILKKTDNRLTCHIFFTYKDVHYLMHADTGYLSNLPLSLVSLSKTLKLW